SDIHFKVGAPPAYRVDGALRNLKSEPLKPPDTEALCRLLLDDASPERLADLREHDTSYSLPGVSRFRVNIFRQRGSLAAILRIIPSEIPTVTSLNLPPAVSKFADFERGLALVTGATGSGKSSTLAALINRINERRPVHIITIEDPIEFLHANKVASVSQRELGIDTATYKGALRAALRQDPDVILVGEMRDAETVDIALKAAETGHMVYSTIHTTDAAKTIGRLVALFPPDEQVAARRRLADNLRGTIGQRLLPRKDGKGRSVACELMIVTSTVQELIKDSARTAELKDVIEKGRDQYGMQSFDQHLIELVRGGHISIETAKAAASSASDLERTLSFME
ncbi:MAG TPA: PilT/PilU family type 4a pilus ATPase, partial [Kofleriaceae bacterium]|nr:PilT/PilU family type 4a pilus ATPase [Kofleriaceae bacterium]